MPEVDKSEYDELRKLSTSRGLSGQDLEALAGICISLTLDDDMGTRQRSRLDGWIEQVRAILDAMWDGERYRQAILLPEHLFYMVQVAEAGLNCVNDPKATHLHEMFRITGMVPEHVRELHAKLMEMVNQVAAERKKLPRHLRRRKNGVVYA